MTLAFINVHEIHAYIVLLEILLVFLWSKNKYSAFYTFWLSDELLQHGSKNFRFH